MRRRFQTSLTIVLIGTVLLGTCGYAVVPMPFKDLSVPFPCMHSRCGCPDAATCWNSCRCLTASQKVAWAEANDVSVPDFVLAQAIAEQPKRKTCSCCSDKLVSSEICNSESRQGMTLVAADSSSASEQCSCSASDEACDAIVHNTSASPTVSDSCCSDSKDDSAPLKGLWFTAFRCQSGPLLWSVISSCLVLEFPDWEQGESLPCEWLCCFSDRATTLSIDIETPPPRHLS